jgi:hypothetical protein
MNEESMPQSTEAPEQQSPEVTSPTEAKPEDTATPDKGVESTKRSFWDKLMGRKAKAAVITAATGAAVAAGMAIAPSANAETQEKPPTSISQSQEEESDTKVTETPRALVTEKDGQVVKIDNHDGTITREGDNRLTVVGEDHGENEKYESAREATEDNLNELVKMGMNIKKVTEVPDSDVTNTDEHYAVTVDVENAANLDRSKGDEKYLDSAIITEKDGKVVGMETNNGTIAEANDGAVTVVGEDRGENEKYVSAREATEETLQDLKDMGMKFDEKDVTPINIPGNEDGHALKVDVDKVQLDSTKL